MRRLVSIALLASGAVAFATDWVAYYHQKVAEFKAANARLDPNQKNIVLVGDSMTEQFTPDRIAADLPDVKEPVVNRGISSDGVGVNNRGVLHRLDESVFDVHPSQIVLLIGYNDLDPSRPQASIDATAKALDEVVTRIQAKLPGVPIVLELSSPTRDAVNPLLDKYRDKEREIASEHGLKTIDLLALLGGPDGRLKPELSVDGVHWRAEAYQIVGKALEAALAAPSPEPAGLPLPARASLGGPATATPTSTSHAAPPSSGGTSSAPSQTPGITGALGSR